MTTSAARRRRSTIAASIVTAVVLLAAGGITAVGASTLVNSQAGRDATADALPVVELPFTPTALLGVADDTGRLTSMAVLVLDPGGAGGSIIPIAATSDSALGLADDRYPVAETLELDGPEAFRREVEAMTALSFDVVEIVTAERLASLLAPIGSVDVEMPVDVLDDESDDPVVESGAPTLDPAESAAVLTAFTDERSDRFNDPGREAVWAAIADAVGAGVRAADAPADSDAVPDTLDAFLARLFAGPVGSRGLTYELPTDDTNPRDVDVVIPDRAEMLLVFSGIAPARIGAPNPSHSFRIETAFTDADAAELGLNAADVIHDVISRLLFVQANVVSVAPLDGELPEVTQIIVADSTIVDTVTELYPMLFGAIDVQQADYRIQGVDIVLRLGSGYLDVLAEGGDADDIADDIADQLDDLLDDDGLAVDDETEPAAGSAGDASTEEDDG